MPFFEIRFSLEMMQGRRLSFVCLLTVTTLLCGFCHSSSELWNNHSVV